MSQESNLVLVAEQKRTVEIRNLWLSLILSRASITDQHTQWQRQWQGTPCGDICTGTLHRRLLRMHL
jgi:hypothetical protein